jgi:hypothetical protein
MLSKPDYNRKFFVATDASNSGVGAMLYQIKDNQTRAYIQFAAKVFDKRQRFFSATHKELLGIVFALDKFHQFIYGERFTLETDHQALTYMFS